MAFPSGGVLSAWPESISDRISRSSKMRWAASSARFDVEELRAISCVTACRAASVCSGVGPASLAVIGNILGVDGQWYARSAENHERSASCLELRRPAIVGIGYPARNECDAAQVGTPAFFGDCIGYSEMAFGIVEEFSGFFSGEFRFYADIYAGQWQAVDKPVFIGFACCQFL